MSIVEEIKEIPNLFHVKGCTTSQIKEAQNAIGIIFPDEFIDYVKQYGAISFYGTEWTGLNVAGYINVVDATKQERNINSNFPSDCFVLENLGIDGIIIAADEKGAVYSINRDKKELIHSSIMDYLKSCIQRADK